MTDNKNHTRALFGNGKNANSVAPNKPFLTTEQIYRAQEKLHDTQVAKQQARNNYAAKVQQPTIPEHPGFQPIAVKQMVDSGIKQITTNPRVIGLLQAMDTPLGILSYGQQEIDNIAQKSDAALEQIDDSNMDFITDQLSQILTLAQQGPGNEPKGALNKLVHSVKSMMIDAKEQSLAQINSIATQMDRVVEQINNSTSSITTKVNNLSSLYEDNINDYHQLSALIEDARAAVAIKENEYQNIINSSASLSALDMEQANRLRQQIDRLDKKLMTFEKMQFVAMQTAPTIRTIQESGYTLLEKFHTIKTITIPMWKRQARLLSDSSAISKGALLADNVDEANNKLMLQASQKFKEGAVATAKSSQRDVIDTNTLMTVNQTLIDTFTEVLAIDKQARDGRAESRRLIENAKQAYATALKSKS